MAHITYQFRLYPTPTQEAALGHQLETLRQVYNTALQWWRDAWEYEKSGRGEVVPRRKMKTKDGDRRLGVVETLYPIFSRLRNLQLEACRNGEPGPHWLTTVGAATMRDTILRVEQAFAKFYKGCKLVVATGKRSASQRFRYPRFKAVGKLSSIPFNNYPEGGCSLYRPSGQVVRADCLVTSRSFRLRMFGVGMVKAFVHRPIIGKIKTVNVDRDADGKWYVFLACEMADRVVPAKDGPAVGVDVGLHNFFTTSDGEQVDNPRFYESGLKAERRMRRSMSRKQVVAKKLGRKLVECRNYQRCRHRLAKIGVRVRNRRREFQHQQAKRLTDRYATICVESLNVSNMVRSGKASRAIGDAGWKGFIAKLKAHAAKAGATVIEVGPKYTSQTCSACGHSEEKNRYRLMFRCLLCGHTEHADVNAAKNILVKGLNGIGSVPARRNVDCPLSEKSGAKVKRAGRSRSPLAGDRSRDHIPNRQMSDDLENRAGAVFD